MVNLFDLFTWIDQDNHTLGGSDISSEYNYLNVEFSKWMNQT